MKPLKWFGHLISPLSMVALMCGWGGGYKRMSVPPHVSLLAPPLAHCTCQPCCADLHLVCLSALFISHGMTLYGLRALNGKWGHLFLGTIAPIGKRSPVEAGSRTTIAGGAQHTLFNTNITTGELYQVKQTYRGNTTCPVSTCIHKHTWFHLSQTHRCVGAV